MMEDRAAWSCFFRDMKDTLLLPNASSQKQLHVSNKHTRTHTKVTVRTTVAFCCRRKRAISRPGHVAARRAFQYDDNSGNLVESDGIDPIRSATFHRKQEGERGRLTPTMDARAFHTAGQAGWEFQARVSSSVRVRALIRSCAYVLIFS